MNWWSTATQEQRLAQIDGAIECRMTGKQLAMNLRFEDVERGSKAILSYANCHGRKFNGWSVSAYASNRENGLSGGYAARRNKGVPEIYAGSAFYIFPRQPAKTNLFERIPYETEEA